MLASTEAFEELSPSKIQKIITIPVIAWPTIFLVFGCACGYGLTFKLLFDKLLSRYVVCLLNTVIVYAAFTPMHDASHGSVAKNKYRYLNDIVGHLAASLFGLPFAAFKHLHLLHHKHTNDILDPDRWTGTGPWFLLPLRWLTIEVHYYYLYLGKIFTRPAAEAVPAVTTLLCIIISSIYLTSIGYGDVIIYGWILPGRLALGLLALLFDYLPHRPHTTTRQQDPFAATSVTALYCKVSWVLTWPLFHQNYHNIHHLAPYVPFYMYATLWHAKKDFLTGLGTKVIPIFSNASVVAKNIKLK